MALDQGIRPARPVSAGAPTERSGAPGGGIGPGADDVPNAPSRWADLAATTLGMFAVVVLVLALVVGPLGVLRQARAQDAAYATLRQQLAEATAPLNPPIDFGAPVALLTIPRLGMRNVILEGTTGTVLRDGPGHRADSPLPAQVGTSIVYGKALTYGAPFRAIPTLGAGEVFEVTTAQGRFVFQVERVRRPGSPLPPPLAAGASRLVLATAEGGPIPDTTVFVDARLVGTAQPATVHPGAVPASERALGVDTGPLLPLVLLLPVLVAAVGAFLVLRDRWGRAQGYLVGAPVLLVLAWSVGDDLAALLPNLV